MRELFGTGRRWQIWSVGVLAFLSCPAAVLAAPFCVSSQALPPQCIYVDPSNCQRDARQQGGVCTVNTAEYKLPPGLGQYCVVTPGPVSRCVYPDRSSCMADAQTQNGACVKAPNVAPYGAPDPYAAVGGG